MSGSGKTGASDAAEPAGIRRWSPVWTTIKTVACVAALSWMAANWISSTDREGLAVLAGRAGAGVIEEPLTTGSLAARAGAARFDPCSMTLR
ncbi:hypothetical protein [Enterovirga rhinocerotis]|uniref:Uncharacterized protein n=1 Tax=Enterovirga rhinocerotis TaxID=1339210 RepID=A0A4R7CBA4_9HYPH|nr:hypothetical protein [Enterovirga rhinocerotis]TDR94037.1 hypothetical protein EV668_1308 [Enterovirga rhinocerotis]